ncbi:MAG: hypothetical protein IJ524_00925 [Bacteroidales bacterium]|nr:hypothetical protein [Bacteroidales bacterium]
MARPDDILQALDAFIRKYYKNLLLRGVLCAVGIVVTLFLAVVLLEHFGWLSPVVRGLLFWLGLAAVAAVTGWLVVRPLLKMQGLGRRISRADAARIIGRHFPEVSDKLLNLLQLMGTENGERRAESGERRTESGERRENGDLLLAAIEQKSVRLRPVPMLNAINLKANRRYLKYALPPLAVLAALLLTAPRVVTEPTKRIAHYQTVYERPAPFAFRILNEDLSAQQGADYELRVTTEGEAQPAEVSIDIEGRRHRMRADRGVFSFSFNKLQRSQTFRLEGGGVTSPEYRLEVVPNPQVVSFRMVMVYPAYTGRPSETLVGLGDAAVPEGTVVRWLFQARDADTLRFGVESGEWRVENVLLQDGRAEVSRRVMENADYAFSVSRGAVGSDTLRYSLSAIKDAVPMIAVEEVEDSLHPDRRLFRGRVKDDYGFTRLVFIHRTTNAKDTTRNTLSEAEIALTPGEAAQEFFFSFNTAGLALAPGDALDYWFEVSDNDAIHGPKTARSQVFEVKIPSEEELEQLLEQQSADVRQSADAQMGELQRLQEKINEMMKKLVDKKELDWQDRKDLEQIRDKQRQVKEMMQQMQRQIEENNRLEQRFREQSEQLMEKQRELDRLMNEVMDEKMKETMAEIERMMQELDKKKVQQQLEQLKMDNAELERQLDQNIELMKRLEMEKRVEQTIQKMDRLAEEQRELGRETEQAKGKESEQLQQKQKELADRFQQMKQDIDQLKQDYKELDPGTDFRVPTDLEQQVEQHQQGAQQQMQQGKNKKASQLQLEAADDMEKLSEALAEAQLDAEQQDLAEDAEQVRQLLKNLVHLSFNQEELIDELKTIYIADPRYQTVITRQNRVKDDFRNVEDSLHAMARRQLQVASAITKELGAADANIARSLSGLLDMNQSFYGSYRNTQAATSMQYSMTSLNNLALILAESLDQMQNQMRQNAQKKKNGQCKNPGKSSSMCPNPGNGKPSPKSMRQMQEELNRQMEALRKQLDKQGNKPGGRHQLGQGQQMSEEFARMAAQQEMIRRMMQQYGQEMKSASGGDPKLAREIDQMMRQMEQTETDLVNRTITRQTIQRQQQILTRLLEHERAEMQREKEERRESHEAGDLYSQPSPAELERYRRQLQPSADPLRTLPPTLQPYYRQKVSDFFYR